MAFQVFWKIKFKSLRAGTDYCVNIYKDGTLPSGYPLTLKGGAQPFVTEEDSDEDMFTPIRTQSGYIRIFDDGLAETSGGVSTSWNWKDLLPATDTDRPVVLQKKVGNSWVTVWQGFMQAQNFGGTLYGNPQEREFPVQCPLTVTQGTDINYTHTSIENFAYLLKQIVDSIPSVSRPTQFVIQGGTDAQAWLLKRIDWQNFVSEDGDGNLVARFSMYQCLEDMCRFWGWTARTCGSTMYLTCADDAAETTFLSLTTAQLATLAAGTTAGDTTATFITANLTGDIFANTNQNDYLQRGHNKAVVNVNINRGDEDVIKFAPQGVEDYLIKQTSSSESIDGEVISYYGDMLSFPVSGAPSPFINGNAVSGKGAFSYIYCSAADSDINNSSIRIKKTYDGTTAFVSMETVFEHSFYNNETNRWNGFIGGFVLHGNVYQKRYKVQSVVEGQTYGDKHMYMRFGVGTDRANAKWWNGRAWGNNQTVFKVTVGNQTDVMWTYYQVSSAVIAVEDNISTDNNIVNLALKGRIFIDFLGSDDLEEVNGERAFFITNFAVEFSRYRKKTGVGKGYAERLDSMEYKANNSNNVRDEWNADCIYASEKNMNFGYGVLLESDGTYVTSVNFGGTPIRPEQHLANRVVNYWQTSKRRLAVDVRTNTIADITPQYKVTLDGTTGYPIAITRDYWNDITTLTIIEL